jgi:hypothetical protein
MGDEIPAARQCAQRGSRVWRTAWLTARHCGGRRAATASPWITAGFAPSTGTRNSGTSTTRSVAGIHLAAGPSKCLKEFAPKIEAS